MEMIGSTRRRLAIIARRYLLQVVLVALTFLAAWIIFSSQKTPGEFYVKSQVDRTHVFRVYDFVATTPGVLNASLSWDSEEILQFRIADEKGDVLVEKRGQSPLEVSGPARSGQTYKLYVLGTKKDQQTPFTLSAASSATEITSTAETDAQ